jgi:DNA-binding NarL/FixJ family response regulator
MNRIKVVLAFSNMIFGEGVGRLLDAEKDMTVVETLGGGVENHIDRVDAIDPDVVLVDFTTLYNSFPEIEGSRKKYHFILLDTNCGRDNLVSAVLKKKISGVLLGNSSSALLIKAIRSVAKGEVWIDKHTFKNILSGINALGSDRSSALSDREREVVSLIGEGFRNKEIAHRLHISEPTVKTHLNRIFQKLNVRNRSELVSYAIKNSELSHGLLHSPNRPKSSVI